MEIRNNALVTISILQLLRMNARKKLLFGALLAGTIGTMVACSKQHEDYKDFIKNGEIVYTAKIDSLDFAPGRNRAKLNWALTTDQRISKVRVYWNDKKDSATLPVQRSAGTDYMNILLENLEEKVYTFEFKTFDDAGHSSVIVDTLVNVYGDLYAATLFNRPIQSVTYRADSTIILWSGANSANLHVEGTYTNQDDVAIDFVVPRTVGRFAVPKLKKGTSFTYRTLYLPHPKSLDIFYMDFASRLVP